MTPPIGERKWPTGFDDSYLRTMDAGNPMQGKVSCKPCPCRLLDEGVACDQMYGFNYD